MICHVRTVFKRELCVFVIQFCSLYNRLYVSIIYNITKQYKLNIQVGYFEKNGAKKKTPLGTGVPKTNVFMTKDLGIIAVIVMLAMED